MAIERRGEPYDNPVTCKTCGNTVRWVDSKFTLSGHLCNSCAADDPQYQKVMNGMECDSCGKTGATWHTFSGEYNYGYFCAECAEKERRSAEVIQCFTAIGGLICCCVLPIIMLVMMVLGG